MFDDAELLRVAEAHGLHRGRLISMSKSGYRRDHPENLAVFNAYLVNDEGRVLWGGDLDLTLDEERLVAVARARGIRLHVLHEGSVFTADGDPRQVGWAVVSVAPEGTVSIGPAWESVARDEAGRLVSRIPGDPR